MRQHTVKLGDTIGSIAALYYSNVSQYFQIMEANPFVSERNSDDPVNDNILIPGEVLNVPDNSLDIGQEIKKETQELMMLVNGEEFTGYTGLTINLDYFMIADTFSFSVNYESAGDFMLNLKRFKYQSVQIYFRGKIKLTGIITTISIKSAKSNTLVASGYSKTGILTELPLPANKYPRKFENTSFVQIATNLCRMFNIKVIVTAAAAAQAGVLYDAIEISITEKIGAFLVRMAKDRSLNLTNTGHGNLLIDSFVSGSEAVFEINKPKNPNLELNATYDGRKLFSEYFLVSSGNEEDGPLTTKFKGFPISAYRPFVIKQEEKSKQSPAKKLSNMAKKSLADAQVITGVIENWLDKNDNLLMPGKVFNLKDPSLQIFENERHVFSKVTLKTAPSGGRIASFTGVLEASVIPS